MSSEALFMLYHLLRCDKSQYYVAVGVDCWSLKSSPNIMFVNPDIFGRDPHHSQLPHIVSISFKRTTRVSQSLRAQ